MHNVSFIRHITMALAVAFLLLTAHTATAAPKPADPVLKAMEQEMLRTFNNHENRRRTVALFCAVPAGPGAELSCHRRQWRGI